MRWRCAAKSLIGAGFCPQPAAATAARTRSCAIRRIPNDNAQALKAKGRSAHRLEPEGRSTASLPSGKFFVSFVPFAVNFHGLVMKEERKSLGERAQMTDLERLRHSASHVLATAIFCHSERSRGISQYNV